MAFIGSGMAGSAQAQGASNSIPSINLDSPGPGQLTITWETPEQTPTDYRIRWANTDLGFPSYSAANEAERGNEHPLGDATTLTLSGLTPGDSYKVQIRSRYYNADRTVHESSGPWSSTATIRVMDEPAEPPQSDDQEPTATPTPTPTPTSTPAPADHGVIQGLSLASSEPGQLVVTWEIPETTPTDYRISWAQSSLSFPSYNDSNGPQKGNLSPLGSETTLTLDNLTPGVDYKIHMRARYYNADRSEHLSSGPWTDASDPTGQGPPASGAHRSHDVRH